MRSFLICVAVSWIALATATTANTQTATDRTRVLVVYGHDPRAPGVLAFSGQLRNVVVKATSETTVEFYEESLDLDRFASPVRFPQLARYFTEKYQAVELDAIVAAGSMSLKFTVDWLANVFPGVPIVYGLAFEPVVDFDALPSHITGTRQPLPFDSTLSFARRLHPDAKRVVLVSGATGRDSIMGVEAVRQMTPILNGMDLIILNDWTYNTLLDSLRAIPPQSIAILSSARSDRAGYEFNTGELIPTLTRAASVPLYGIARNWIGDGITGGAMMDFAEDGKRTGEQLIRVLRRGPGEPYPKPVMVPSPFIVDWRQMQRWGLSEDRLPPDTEVVFRTPTIWERNWPAILGVLALLVIESALISRLLLERRQRMRAQKAVEKQRQYEHMLAELTADAVRLAPEDAPRALEDALARIARYARASEAILNVIQDAKQRVDQFYWSEATGVITDVPADTPKGARLQIPLIADNERFGVLELYRTDRDDWNRDVVTRLLAAADLITGALARERAARALEESRVQIAHIARVATIGELASAVSHDLRQPLTAMRANAEAGQMLLRTASPDLAEARAIFKDIVSDNERAAKVIDHIGMLVRKQQPVTTSVDLNEMCREVAELLERDIRARGVRLRLDLSEKLPPVTGDGVQLQQVVINLVLNALDATASVPGGDEIVLGTLATQRNVEIFVSDTGPGLKPEMLTHVFDAFFSTKPHGLGMGLAIVRAIVKRHRGTVRAENTATGAVFRVTIPAAEKPDPLPASRLPRSREPVKA